MRAKKNTGSRLVSDCLRLLDMVGVLAWRNNTTGVFDPVRKVFRSFKGMKGVADILGILHDLPDGCADRRRGVFLAVECKSGSGRMTADQKHFQGLVEDAGGIYILARSTNDLAAKLRELGFIG